MDDFFDSAAPVLQRLIDDPERGAPKILNSTTMPIEPEEIEGELHRVELDHDILTDRILEGVNADSIDAGKKVVREAGLDVLAFYKSFRFKDIPPFAGEWGIFLIDAGIATVSAYFNDTKPDLPSRELNKIAMQMLVSHEQYHFWIDAWALMQEAEPVWGRQYKKYEYYIQAREEFSLHSSNFEESLANHYLFRTVSKNRLSDGTLPTQMLANFLDICPEPYSNYRMNVEERRSKERQLAGAVINGCGIGMFKLLAIDPEAKRIGRMFAQDIALSLRKYPVSDINACPIFIIQEKNFSSRVAPYQLPDRSEFKRFVTNYLAGYLTRRTKHEFFEIDNGETIKFPNSHEKEILPWEFENMIMKAGMRRQEYWQEKRNTKTWKKGCPRAPVKPPLAQ